MRTSKVQLPAEIFPMQVHLLPVVGNQTTAAGTQERGAGHHRIVTRKQGILAL